MTTLKETAQMALDYLESEVPFYECEGNEPPAGITEAIETLRAALEQQKPEPVVWIDNKQTGNFLNVAPPQREWQTLTENEIKHLWYEACQTNLELTSQLIVHLARNVEAKLKEKNNAL